jgi:hypothetical protein
VLSILFRLRHAPALAVAAEDREPPDSSLLDPRQYDDVTDLTRRGSQAARQAYAELASASPERVRMLTDTLLQSQPRACSAILADGSFLAGKVSPESPARRAVRDMHAIHRDSLVVFGSA